MNWKRKLEAKTRQPEFVWRLVFGILAAGLLVGYFVQHSSDLPRNLAEALSESEEVEPPGSWSKLESAAAEGRWSEVWWAIPKKMVEDASELGPAVLASLTGIAWLVFLLQAVQVEGFRDGKLWLALVAVPFGVLSIWPTLFFVLWQEYSWGLEQSSSLIAGLRFFILGVGLREELAKLLCLLPLMPLLLRMRSELAALIVSACVGLGFALEENIGYFTRSAGTAAIGRFLTANPFHMTLTGLIGLVVYRGLRNPSGWGPHVLATFVLMVFAHGLYDAFYSLPSLIEYNMASTIIFALVVYQFFHELRELRSRRKDTVSLSATFLAGVSLVTACTFVYLSSQVGWTGALTLLVPQALAMAIMVYLFLREMPETMVTV